MCHSKTETKRISKINWLLTECLNRAIPESTLDADHSITSMLLGSVSYREVLGSSSL